MAGLPGLSAQKCRHDRNRHLPRRPRGVAGRSRDDARDGSPRARPFRVGGRPLPRNGADSNHRRSGHDRTPSRTATRQRPSVPFRRRHLRSSVASRMADIIFRRSSLRSRTPPGDRSSRSQPASRSRRASASGPGDFESSPECHDRQGQRRLFAEDPVQDRNPAWRKESAAPAAHCRSRSRASAVSLVVSFARRRPPTSRGDSSLRSHASMIRRWM